jgi:pyruvate kinase
MFHMTSKEPNELSDEKVIHINNEAVLRYLKLNDVVYIDDGKVVGIVKNIGDNGVDMEVKIAGKLRSNSSVRFVNGKHA